MNEVITRLVMTIVPAAPYCLPADATNAMDTAKFWAGIVAGAVAVVAMIMIGLGIFANSSVGGHASDGGALMGKLGKWILGAVLVSSAVGLAALFVHVPTDCVPMPA